MILANPLTTRCQRWPATLPAAAAAAALTPTNWTACRGQFVETGDRSGVWGLGFASGFSGRHGLRVGAAMSGAGCCLCALACSGANCRRFSIYVLWQLLLHFVAIVIAACQQQQQQHAEIDIDILRSSLAVFSVGGSNKRVLSVIRAVSELFMCVCRRCVVYVVQCNAFCPVWLIDGQHGDTENWKLSPDIQLISTFLSQCRNL